MKVIDVHRWVIAAIAASTLTAFATPARSQGPYGIFYPLPASRTVQKLSPSARYELWSFGPRVSVSYGARLQLRAASQSRQTMVQPPLANAQPRSLYPYYPGLRTPPSAKPFAHVQPPPTAFEQYWPFLLNARENPRTGRVLLTLP